VIYMKNTRIMAVVGPKNAGKTRLIETYAPKLKKEFNWNLSTVKCAYKPVRFDEGDYSYDVERHLKAGIKNTIFRSSLHTVQLKEGNCGLAEVINGIGDVDLVFVEAQLDDVEGYPQIAIINSKDDLEKYSTNYTVAITSLDPDFQSEHGKFIPFDLLLDTIRDKSFPALPGLDCGHCGNSSCDDMMVSLINGESSIDDCEPRRLENEKFSLIINGKPVHCVGFVRDIITGSVTGMLATLKGVDSCIEEVELRFSSQAGQDKSGKNIREVNKYEEKR